MTSTYSLFAFLVLIALGLAWLLYQRNRLSRERDHLQSHLDALEEQNKAVQERLETLAGETHAAESLQRTLSEHLESVRSELDRSIQALGTDVLQRALEESNQRTLSAVSEQLQTEQARTDEKLEEQRRAVEQALHPLQEALQAQKEEHDRVEQSRRSTESELQESITSLADQQRQLLEKLETIAGHLAPPAEADGSSAAGGAVKSCPDCGASVGLAAEVCKQCGRGFSHADIVTAVRETLDRGGPDASAAQGVLDELKTRHASALQHGSERERIEAAHTLRATGDRSLLPTLVDALASVGMTGGELPRELVSAVEELSDRSSAAPLRKALRASLAPPVRRRVIERARVLGIREAVPELQEVLVASGVHTTPGADVRVSAAEALGDLGDTTAMQPLLQTLVNAPARADALVDACIEALCKLDGTELLTQVREIGAKARGPHARRRLIRLLGETGDPAAIEPLIEQLQWPASTGDAVRRGLRSATPLTSGSSHPEPLLTDEDFRLTAETVRKIGDDAVRRVKSEARRIGVLRRRKFLRMLEETDEAT